MVRKQTVFLVCLKNMYYEHFDIFVPYVLAGKETCVQRGFAPIQKQSSPAYKARFGVQIKKKVIGEPSPKGNYLADGLH